MNTSDMYTREEVNRIHLDEMHRAAESRRQLRKAKPVSHSGNAATKKQLFYTLVFAAFVILIGAYLAVFVL